MPEITLAAEVGRATGTSDARRLRAEGKIPGVVYGRGIEPVIVAVDGAAFRLALSGDTGLNTLLDLVAGKQHYLVLAREVQRHPVRGTVSHVDFQVVDRSQGVEVEVPVQIVGDAVEVRHHDWEVDQQLFTVHVKAAPDRIPSAIVVDISALAVGGAIRVGDLELPDGVESTQDPLTTVVGTHAARVAVAPTEEGAAEAAPAEEAAPAAAEPVADES
jgi:large subunit ribosomal protein L25